MNSNLPRIAGVVVLYCPTAEVQTTVQSCLDQVEQLYLIDNSEQASAEVVMSLVKPGKTAYLSNHVNLGIATALNRAAQMAVEEGYEYLLTMDQDSVASDGMVSQMLDCLAAVDATVPIGMLAPFHVTPAAQPAANGPDCYEVMTPMTSGCLLNLAAYRAAGPFRDDFFIDFVDNEYCLRLRREGFRVIRANRALLKHQVGELRTYGPFVATNHGPLRRYYKTRNRLYVFREYLTVFPGHCLFDLVRIAKEIGSILLFEEQKCAKLQMMLIGAQHFFQGRLGSFDEASR